MQALLTVDQRAGHLQKSVVSIRSDTTRNPRSLPPIYRLLNTKLLLLHVEDIERRITPHVTGGESSSATKSPQPEKSRQVRPTAAESPAALD